jgi:hypothetical protein
MSRKTEVETKTNIRLSLSEAKLLEQALLEGLKLITERITLCDETEPTRRKLRSALEGMTRLIAEEARRKAEEEGDAPLPGQLSLPTQTKPES